MIYAEGAQVHVLRRWHNDTLAIYVHRRVEGETQVLTLLPPDQMEWRGIAEGAEAGEPTLLLPAGLAGQIAAELMNVVPPNTEQALALKDARAVRDRLLTLVEKVVGS